MDEELDSKPEHLHVSQLRQALRDSSCEIRKALALRTEVGVIGEPARMLRVQMARAGRVLVQLVLRQKLEQPNSLCPWLTIALGFEDRRRGSLFRNVECEILPPVAMADWKRCTSDGLSAANIMFALQDRHEKPYLDAPAVAARNRFVSRHVFLEAVSSWLPSQIGLPLQDLSLLHWRFEPTERLELDAIPLVSDWHERNPPFSSTSGGADIASACAAAADALRLKLRSVGPAETEATERVLIHNRAPQGASGPAEAPGRDARAVEDIIDVIRVRTRDPKKAQIVVKALEAVRALQNEWVEGARLEGLGIPPSTLHHYSTKHWMADRDYKVTEFGDRLYLRTSVIQYLKCAWNPRPSKESDPSDQ